MLDTFAPTGRNSISALVCSQLGPSAQRISRSCAGARETCPGLRVRDFPMTLRPETDHSWACTPPPHPPFLEKPASSGCFFQVLGLVGLWRKRGQEADAKLSQGKGTLGLIALSTQATARGNFPGVCVVLKFPNLFNRALQAGFAAQRKYLELPGHQVSLGAATT